MFEQVMYCKNVDELSTHLNSEGSYLFLVAEKTGVAPLANLKNIVFTGAIFPKLIFGEQTYDEGFILAKMDSLTSYQMVPMDNLPELHISDDMNAILTFIDGYSVHTDRFLELLYTLLPEQTKLIGAGAGIASMHHLIPVLFDYKQLYTNYAIVISSKRSIGLGVKNGYQPLMGPFIATHCFEHSLEKINFQDAYKIYKSVIEERSDFRFHTTSFFNIAHQFPIGVLRYNKDFIIREPFATDGKVLQLNADIDANSVITILQAYPDTIIQAAHEAALISKNGLKESAPSSVLVIDCISRYLLLGEGFPKELHAIQKAYDTEILIWGALSLGEIGNANQEGIEYFNNTCVVGTL